HTSFSRDWSSDVCSSDLGGPGLDPSRATLRRVVGLSAQELGRQVFAQLTREQSLDGRLFLDALFVVRVLKLDAHASRVGLGGVRSEERRVGEAGRAGCAW